MAEQELHKYKGVPKDIVPLLKEYEIKYFRENIPVPFHGMLIHPVAVRDYESFLNCLPCLTLNRKASPEGLGKTDLGWLIMQMKLPDKNPQNPDDDQWISGRMWSIRFQKLIEIVFQIKNGLKCRNPNCGHVIAFESEEWFDIIAKTRNALDQKKDPEPLKCPKCGAIDAKDKHAFTEMIKISDSEKWGEERLYIDGNELTPQDFRLLRYIIPFQNMPDYRDDSKIDPKLKEDFEKRAELLNKKNGGLTATVERKVIAVSISTGINYKELYGMPMRTFNQMFSMVHGKMDYFIAKLITSVFPPEKGKPAPDIGDWVYEKDEDMYAGVYRDLDEQKHGFGVK
jgi:hypothetical protein